MATKPNETYTWGENATHEQVAAYADTGWPSDVIPPKRTQFNWYQNLVGKWLGWAEDAVDEIVGTVLDRWFTVVYPSGGANWEQTIPNENGLYEYRAGVPELHLERWLVTVTNGTAVAVRLRTTASAIPTHFELAFGVWDGNQGQWVSEYTFNRANSRTTIMQESATRYVTPKGLVDYFRVDDTNSVGPLVVPHQSGVYTVGSVGTQTGIAIVSGDVMFFQRALAPIGNSVYLWENNEWVEQT